MVAPDLERINGIRGWLLGLCLVLLVYQPFVLALAASTTLVALPIRGLPLGLILTARLLVTAVGVAAGLALAGRRPAAVTLAKASLTLSVVTDLFVYSTPYYPSNRTPGTTPLYVAWSIAFYGGWLAYLFRSRRVQQTCGD